MQNNLFDDYQKQFQMSNLGISDGSILIKFSNFIKKHQEFFNITEPQLQSQNQIENKNETNTLEQNNTLAQNKGGKLKSKKYRKQNKISHKRIKILRKKLLKYGGLDNRRNARLKNIILQKINKYIDIEDLIEINHYEQMNSVSNEQTKMIFEKSSTAYFTKKEAIYFLLTVLHFYDFTYPDDQNKPLSDVETYVKQELLLYNITDINHQLDTNIPDLIRNGIPEYLKNINDPYADIVFNKIPGVSDVLLKQHGIITQLIDKIIVKIDKAIQINKQKTKGGKFGDTFRSIWGKTKNAISQLGKSASNATRRFGQHVGNMTFNLTAINTGAELANIEKIFKKSYDTMIDNKFENLKTDLTRNFISKDIIIKFTECLTWPTLMVGHFTCSSLANFISFLDAQQLTVTLFTIALSGGHSLPAQMGIQTISCFTSFAIIGQFLYFMNPLSKWLNTKSKDLDLQQSTLIKEPSREQFAL